MIVDTSAIVAVFLKEPRFEELIRKLASAPGLGIGGPTLAETGLVLAARTGCDPRGMLARFLQEFRISVIPFGDQHWVQAVDAFVRFGKGRHAASLNFGDCLAYATAKLARQPLVFVGEDFARTDIESG